MNQLLEHDCFEYVKAERAAVNAGMVAIELERLGALNDSPWPTASRAQWSAAIERLITAGKLKRVNGSDIAIVHEEPKKTDKHEQLSLFGI